MNDRLVPKYLRPQFTVFENVLIEVAVIVFVFMTPKIVRNCRFDDFLTFITDYVIEFFVQFVFLLIVYGIPRGGVGTYLAYRKLVMSDDKI